MKFRITSKACLAGLLLSLCLPAERALAREAPTLTVYGDMNRAPYEFLHDGEPEGVMVDLVRAIAERTGRSPVIKLGQWSEAQTAVLIGSGDALSIMVRTGQRERMFDFSEPTFRMTFSLFALAERQDGFRPDLAGVRIGVLEGGFPQAFLHDKHPSAHLVVVSDIADGVRHVLRREIDAFAVNTWSGEYFLSELRVSGVRSVVPPFAERETALALPKGRNPELLAAINQALRQIKADGTFDEIVDRWSAHKVYVLSQGSVVRAAEFAGLTALALFLIGVLAWVVRRQRRALALSAAERQRSEAALGESEMLFKSLTDAMPGFVFVADRDGGNTFTNAAFAAYAGTTAAELLGDGWSRVLHPEDAACAAQIRAAAVRNGTDYEAVYRFRRHDGVYRWFLCRGKPIREPSGRIVRWVGVGIDIDDAKQLEKRLREQRDRARGYLQVAGVALLVLDRQGRVETINRQGAEMLGYRDEAALLGRDWFALAFPARLGNGSRVQFEKLLAGELAAPAACEGPLLCADGSERLVAWRHTLLHDGDGRTIGTLSSGQDVTDARRVEAVLARDKAELERLAQERTAQLVQLHKMEALGQLTGGVAHDFNNVLQGLASCLFVLDRYVPTGSRAMFEAAQQSIESGARLTQAMLAFARRQTLVPEAIGLAYLLEGIHPMLERTLGGRIALHVDVPEALPPAMVDRAQLESAILNLAINARDAMPTGGSLTLRAAQVDVGAQREAGRPPELKAGRYLALSVEDTGTGMDEATLACVFEPFFTTKEAGKGSGLGLSMVHGMAVQSGGGVHIESVPGRGTKVSLYLPPAHPVTGAEGVAANRGDPVDGIAVLLVDDNHLVRNSLKFALADLGCSVFAVGSGNEALDILRRNDDIDALMTDFAMPGMDGVELIAQARGMRSDLPAILITGYAERPANVDDVTLLHKPFQAADVVAALAGARRRKAYAE